MYPPLFINSKNENENATIQRKMIFKNCDGKLCCELCVVFCVISGICSVYLLFLMHFASEGNVVNISLT
uniref:Uncharacterized protein n=1 Tax=viral metagenome TaxID=1070528 RepID=A0A6C0FB75_9ZZZZ